MCGYSHVDFRAILSKLDFIHVRGHKMNPPCPVFSQVFWDEDTARVKSVSFVSNHDRQRVIWFADVLNVDCS